MTRRFSPWAIPLAFLVCLGCSNEPQENSEDFRQDAETAVASFVSDYNAYIRNVSAPTVGFATKCLASSEPYGLVNDENCSNWLTHITSNMHYLDAAIESVGQIPDIDPQLSEYLSQREVGLRAYRHAFGEMEAALKSGSQDEWSIATASFFAAQLANQEADKLQTKGRADFERSQE